MTGPLDGVRVLDLADRSAALTGRILADLGAEVTMVEPPHGASIRRCAPRFAEGAESAAHHYFSANKRSMTLDLEAEADVFRGLVAGADVLLETEQPGRLDDLGLGHGALRAINPGLIQCSVTPFGLHGEWRHWKATDIVSVAAGGLAWLSGEPRGIPVQGGANVAHVMAGLIATSGITIALHDRDVRGGGTGIHLDLSVQEAVVMAAMQTANPTHWTWHDRIPRRPGLSNALRCADGGYVGHLVRPDRFPAFLDWAERVGIDHGMTVDDWEWARLDAPRKDNPVAATTLALAAALTRDEFAAGALEADIVCLPVLGLDDLARTEQFAVNDQFLTVDHPRLGALGFVRSPVDGMREAITIRPAPEVGAHDSERPAPVPAAAPIPTPAGDPSRALEGLRIVDFTWVLAGPIGTRLLANFGADVIRIESATKPDSMRSQIGPDGVPDPDLGGLHNSVNTGKRSLAVDLTDPRGKALVDELIDTADVVINNFRPGALERMGFGFDELSRRNPGIVLCNLPGAHPVGPWAERPSMGNILMAASGFNMLTGFEGERPRGVGIAYPDFTGPHLLATTVLAAVREQRRTGVGQEITVPQLSGMVAMLGAEWLAYQATGELPPRRANRSDDHAPHGIYPCLPSEHSDDEWIAVAVADDDGWERLRDLEAFGPVPEPSRFETLADRKAHEDDLDELMRAWTARHDKWELAALLQANGIAAAPVEHLADTYERDPQLRHHYQHVTQPSRPDLDVPVDREPVRWVGAGHQLTRSPGVGEHGYEIVCDILGRSAEEFAELLGDGVLS